MATLDAHLPPIDDNSPMPHLGVKQEDPARTHNQVIDISIRTIQIMAKDVAVTVKPFKLLPGPNLSIRSITPPFDVFGSEVGENRIHGDGCRECETEPEIAAAYSIPREECHQTHDGPEDEPQGLQVSFPPVPEGRFVSLGCRPARVALLESLSPLHVLPSTAGLRFLIGLSCVCGSGPRQARRVEEVVDDPDLALRLAAPDHLRESSERYGDAISRDEVQVGFSFEGNKYLVPRGSSAMILARLAQT